MLYRVLKKYPSFMKAKVVRHKISGKPKGFGFVSFKNVHDYIQAIKDMKGSYRKIKFNIC